MIPKHKPIRSQKLRDSAKGEECCFQIPGICSFDSEKTVLCHLPDESHGMGLKANDLGCAAYGCYNCHQQIDRREKSILSDCEREFYMRRALQRTIVRMHERNLIRIV